MLSTKALQVVYSVEFHRLPTLGPTHCTTPIPRRYGILLHPDASWPITAASIASIASIVARCQNLAMSSHQPCRPVVPSWCHILTTPGASPRASVPGQRHLLWPWAPRHWRHMSRVRCASLLPRPASFSLKIAIPIAMPIAILRVYTCTVSFPIHESSRFIRHGSLPSIAIATQRSATAQRQVPVTNSEPQWDAVPMEYHTGLSHLIGAPFQPSRGQLLTGTDR